MKIVRSGVTSRAKRALACAAVAGAAGLTLGGVAHASDAADDAIATAVDQPRNTVSGVDIEAQQRRQPSSARFTAALQDTPRTVTVIPREIIEQTNATSLTDILRTSPGITFGAGEGGQPLADRPFIRGQASANNIFVDGVRDTGGQVREVFNLEQVEVIKGADSAYSGRGSGGGSINLTSKRAKLDNFVNASAGAGTSGFLRGTVDANYQVGDTSAIRLNIMGSKGDIPKRDAVDFERYGLALAGGIGLGTETRIQAFYYRLRSDEMPDYGVPLFTKAAAIPRTASGVLAVDRSAFYGLKARDYQKTHADIGTLSFEHDVSEALKVRNVFRYSKTLNDYVVTNPGDGGAAQFVAGEWWMKRGTKTRWNQAETVANVTDIYGVFSTGAIRHSYDVGLELNREVNRNASYIIYTAAGSTCPTGFTNNVTAAGVGDCTRLFAPNPNDPWQGRLVLPTPARNIAKTVGVYAFDTIAFGERWLLNLGVRYDDYSVNGYDASTPSANGAITGQTVYTPRSGKWTFTNYQAGLTYKPTSDGSIYVSYATSSTPPTIASGDQNSATGTGTGNLANVLLEPEDVESFEVGVKWAFFNQRLSTSAAYFDLTRKNAQIQVDAGVYAQVGETAVKGFELGVTGNVTSRWSVFGGYTYMDSELVRGAYNSVNVGDPLANTPKHSFSLFTTYQLTDAFSFGGGAYHVSKSFGGNQGGAGGGGNVVYAPAYWRFDVYAAYRVNENIDLRLNVQNAGDKDYIVRTNGVHHADYGPARQAILTLNVRY